MNKISKLFPVAAAALLLASCNSDDFFGNNGKAYNYDVATIDVTVEDPEAITRANTTGAWLIDWQAGDILRVYDSKVQKYDKFVHDGNLFALANGVGDANVQYVNPYIGATEEENAYALFYGANADDGDANAVSYSGWKQGGTDGVPTALVYLPKDLLYTESKLSTDNAVSTYKTAMPLWGRVSTPAEGTEAQFSARLNWLTSYIRLRFENANKLNDPIVAVHVKALAWGATSATDKNKFKALATADKKFKAWDANLTDGTVKQISALGAGKNLNGWFEAELKTDGQLVNTADAAVKQPAASRNQIDIDVTGLLEANENYLWIPVVSGQKYDVLAITYTLEGGDEIIANVYFDYEAERAKGKAIGIEFPNTNYILDGTTTAKITTGIKNTYDGTTSAVVVFNKADEPTAPSQHLTVSTGAASKNTIYLPQISDKDLTIIIDNKAGEETVLDEDLTIADATGITEQGTGKVKIYIKEFDDLGGTPRKVTINSKANISLGGDFSIADLSVETGEKTTNLTLGAEAYGAAASFDYAAKTFVATNGNLTVKDMVKTGMINFNSAAGTLAVNDDLAQVTVTNATSATITKPVNTVEALKNVTINIAYDDDPANMTIGTLNLHKGVTAVTLEGGIIGNITSQAAGATAVVAADKVLVTSSGLSAIRKNSYATGNIAFTSSLATSTAPGAKTYVNAFEHPATAATGKIYTAAQLAAIGQSGAAAADGTASDANITGFELKTNITSLTNWKSPNLLEAFAGGKAANNGLTIAGVDAPLFGTVSANISDVDLTVAIDKNENTIGGLAKINDADVNIENVKVAGTIKGTYNVGGIFGTTKAAANTINIGDQGTAAKKVEVTATFTNKTNYTTPYNGRTPYAGTFGKFIGQAAANTTVVIATECIATAAFDKTALHFDYNRIANDETGMNEWQFQGNTDYIGYSPAATVSLTYGGKVYDKTYRTDASGDGQLKYTKSTNKVTGIVYYNGILYSPLSAAQKAAIKTALGGGWDAAYNAATTDWSGVTVKSHNLYVPFAQ